MDEKTQTPAPGGPAERPEQTLSTASLAQAGEAKSEPKAKGEPRSFAPTPEAEAAKTAPLFPEREVGDLRGKWDAVQASFVDEPRKAVADADALVASAMKRLAEMFAEERSGLEAQWDRGGEVSTEDLRLALRRYRAFFGRLLEV
jgi:hypothetical protein